MPGALGGIISEGSAHAGELLPQVSLGGEWFDDVHGIGFRLVTIDPAAPELPTDVDEWFTSIGGKVVAVDADAGSMRPWLDANGRRWALQTPGLPRVRHGRRR